MLARTWGPGRPKPGAAPTSLGFGGTAPGKSLPAEPGLTSVAAVRRLSPEQAGAGAPLHLRGVVTFNDALQRQQLHRGGMFLQDATGGIFVLAKADVYPPNLRAGDEVEVMGVSGKGQMSPIAVADRIAIIGRGAAPKAVLVTPQQLTSGEKDGQWVRACGIIQASQPGPMGWTLILVRNGVRLPVRMGPLAGAPPPNLVDAQVNLDAVSTTVFAALGRRTGVELLAPSWKDVTVTQPAPTNPFALPVRRISDLGRFLADGVDHHRVRVVGTVSFQASTGSVTLQDATGGVWVPTALPGKYPPGTRLTVAGFVRGLGDLVVLDQAVARSLGRGPPPVPIRLELNSGWSSELNGELVRAHGQLQHVERAGGRIVLYLADGDQPYEAVMFGSQANPLMDLKPGSMLATTGILWTRQTAVGGRAPVIALRNTADLAVLHQPSWWTARRLLRLTAALAAAGLLALLWVFFLRRGLRKQRQTILRQVRERKELEEQLQHAQRMEAVGRLAGGIAHDFNNLLTVVGGRAEVLQLKAPDDHWRRDLGAIQQAVGRAAGLTRQLLAYSRRQPLAAQKLALDQVARDMEGILHTLVGERVTLRVTSAPDLPPIFADRGQIEQVLMNLAVNARDAMPEGGRLTYELTLRTLSGAGGEAAGFGALPPGEYVCLSAADSGMGMTAEVRDRLFEPFFTTKEFGKGTGLGLAVVYGIVRQSGGGIRVLSEPGKGARFELMFPCWSAQVEAEAAARVAAAPGEAEGRAEHSDKAPEPALHP